MTKPSLDGYFWYLASYFFSKIFLEGLIAVFIGKSWRVMLDVDAYVFGWRCKARMALVVCLIVASWRWPELEPVGFG